MTDDTIIDLWGASPNRPPIDTHHPAVRTHPVTKLKALNVNPGFVTGFAELKKLESGRQSPPIYLSTTDLLLDKILDFLAYHIHSADDHYVRWKWAVGSVAMWDNRYLYIDHVLINFLIMECAYQLHSSSGHPWDIQRNQTRY